MSVLTSFTWQELHRYRGLVAQGKSPLQQLLQLKVCLGFWQRAQVRPRNAAEAVVLVASEAVACQAVCLHELR